MKVVLRVLPFSLCLMCKLSYAAAACAVPAGNSPPQQCYLFGNTIFAGSDNKGTEKEILRGTTQFYKAVVPWQLAE